MTVNILQPSSLKNKQTNFNIIVKVTYLHIMVEIKLILIKKQISASTNVHKNILII